MTVRTNDITNLRLEMTACTAVKHAIRTRPSPELPRLFKFARFSRQATRAAITIGLIRGDGGPIRPEVREAGLLEWDRSERKWHIQPRPNLTAAIQEQDPGERYDLTVTARAPWPAKREDVGVLLDTGVPGQPEYMVRFDLDVEPRLRAEPSTFSTTDVCSPLGGRVRLVWSEDRPPGHIAAAEVDDPNLGVEVLDTAAGQEVVVRARKRYVPIRPRSSAVTVRTNDGLVPEFRIWVVRPRAIQVSCDHGPDQRQRECYVGSFEHSAGPQTTTITIRRGDAGPLQPEVLTFRERGAVADLRVITPGEHYELDLTILPPWPCTTYKNSVTLRTGVAEQPHETIHFWAEFPKRIEVVPWLNIPSEVKQPLELVSELRWVSEPAGRVLEAAVDDPHLSVRLERRHDRDFLWLHVPDGYSHTPGQRPRIIVRTSDPKLPEFKIDVY